MFKFCPVPSVVGPLKQFGACFPGWEIVLKETELIFRIPTIKNVHKI